MIFIKCYPNFSVDMNIAKCFLIIKLPNFRCKSYFNSTISFNLNTLVLTKTLFSVFTCIPIYPALLSTAVENSENFFLSSSSDVVNIRSGKYQDANEVGYNLALTWKSQSKEGLCQRKDDRERIGSKKEK